MSFWKRIHEPKPDMSDVIFMLHDAGRHLMEVQQRPSTEYADEWREACYDMRIALRVSMKWMQSHWDEYMGWVEENMDDDMGDGDYGEDET